ncbi:hypothetical protein ACOMHN_031178 [Nucella lapillus]
MQPMKAFCFLNWAHTQRAVEKEENSACLGVSLGTHREGSGERGKQRLAWRLSGHTHRGQWRKRKTAPALASLWAHTQRAVEKEENSACLGVSLGTHTEGSGERGKQRLPWRLSGHTHRGQWRKRKTTPALASLWPLKGRGTFLIFGASTALCPGETPGGDGMLDRLTAVPAAPPCVQERRQTVWGDQFGWGVNVRLNELKLSQSSPVGLLRNEFPGEGEEQSLRNVLPVYVIRVLL